MADMAGWKIRIAVALTAAAVGATPAAACSLSIAEVTSTTWTGNRGQGYDVFDTRRQAQAVTFRVRSPDGGCQFFSTVAPVSTEGGNGRLRGGVKSLQYSVSKDASGSQPLKPLTQAVDAETFAATAASGGGMVSFQFALALPSQQVVPPGQYRDDLEISAYEGTLANPILRDRRRVAVIVPVPAVAELSFSEGGSFDPNFGSFTVNFRSLRAGMQQVVRLKARSNAGYRINFRSINGVLRHIDPSDDSVVPYTMTIDGATVPLRRNVPTQAILNSGATGPEGRQHIIDFIIGDIGNASAGDYNDTIDLTVFTQQ